MDDRGALSDAALDRAIRNALDVHPSPEFLARVRQRLEREPPPAWWRRPELVVAAAGLLLAASLWSLFPRREMAVPALQAPIVRHAPSVIAMDPAVEPPAPVTEPTVRVASRRARTARPPAPADRLPLVILAENERAALRMLGEATRIAPPEPSEITVSAERAARARPALPPVSFDAPDMAPPVFESVSLE